MRYLQINANALMDRSSHYFYSVCSERGARACARVCVCLGNGPPKPDFMASGSVLYREASGPDIFHVSLKMHKLDTHMFLSSQVTPAFPLLNCTSSSTRFQFFQKSKPRFMSVLEWHVYGKGNVSLHCRRQL